MIQITAKEEDVLIAFVRGLPYDQIAKECGKNITTIRALLRLLSAKGLLIPQGRAKYKPTGEPYEIVKFNKPQPRPKVEKEESPKHDVNPDILFYIEHHYPLYKHKRGVLARRLGISRTVFNQIVIDYKLVKEA